MRNELFPYPTLSRDLALEIRRVDLRRVARGKLQDSELPTDCLDGEAREVSLWRAEPADWSSAAISLRLTVGEDELLTPAMDEEGVTAVCVAAALKANARQACVLRRVGEREWTGSMDVDRRCFAGTAELRGLITAERFGRKGRLLGESEAWRLQFDPAFSPFSRTSIPIRWVDFASEQSGLPLREYAHESHYLDIQDNVPTLFLNKSFPGLPELFSEDARAAGIRLAILEPLRTSIAKSAWLAMYQASVAAVQPGSEGEAEWPTSQWKADVLRMLFPHIYPDLDPEAALEEAHREYSSGNSDWSQSKALAVIAQKVIKEGQSLRKAIQQQDHVGAGA